jgi:hypothetical protein
LAPVGGSVSTVGAALDPGVVVGPAQFGAIVMVWGCVAVNAGELASATCTVKSKVPGLVGVPVIAPSDGAKLRPGGNVPDATDQVNGAVPPSTLSTLAEYGSHSAPAGNGVQEICTAPTMLVFQPLKVLQINVAPESP